MMKKARGLCLMLILFFLTCFPAAVSAQNELQEERYEEGSEEGSEDRSGQAFQHTPFLEQGQTFVPLRELADLLGYEVGWQEEKEQVLLTGPEQKLALFLLEQGMAKLQVTQDGGEEPADEPFLGDYHQEKGHIFVPLRLLADVFSWRLAWDEEAWVVHLQARKADGEVAELSFGVEKKQPAKEEQVEEPAAPPQGKRAYLTFDDGPSKNVTPRILDLLKKKDAPATFFVTGENAERFPGIIRRIHEDGHTIGNHTYSHRTSIIYSGPQAFMGEVERTEKILYELTGERTWILRAPYGSYPNLTAPYRQALAERGYQYVDWNVDSMDSRSNTVPTQTIVNAVKRQVPGKDPAVILFHDLPAKTTTAQALPEIISFLRERGYTLKPLTEQSEMITHW